MSTKCRRQNWQTPLIAWRRIFVTTPLVAERLRSAASRAICLPLIAVETRVLFGHRELVLQPVDGR
jgi:hypothetical protein